MVAQWRFIIPVVFLLNASNVSTASNLEMSKDQLGEAGDKAVMQEYEATDTLLLLRVGIMKFGKPREDYFGSVPMNGCHGAEHQVIRLATDGITAGWVVK